jgi:D-glycero-D-manno-heptose 1,7-bisphosphate phosphatase
MKGALMPPLKACVFLDRDGVINVPPVAGWYILNPKEFRLIDGVREAIRQLNAAGYLVIVITNQRCVSRGLIDEAGLAQIHAKLRDLLAPGAYLDAIYYCPHSNEAGCDCRKPKPGLLIRAAQDFGIDPATSFMVGDSVGDIRAGKAFGCKTILVDSGRKEEESGADYRVDSLFDAITRHVLIH